MELNEKYKIGYSGAMDMTSLEGKMIWSAFQALMGANAVVVTLVGAAMKVYQEEEWLPRVMVLFGICVCIIWFLTLTRQFSYYRYWIAWARELERQSLAPQIEMFGKGKEYGEGSGVNLGGQDLRMSWFGRVFRVQWLMSVVIFMFLLLYIFELILSLTN